MLVTLDELQGGVELHLLPDVPVVRLHGLVDSVHVDRGVGDVSVHLEELPGGLELDLLRGVPAGGPGWARELGGSHSCGLLDLKKSQ